MLACLLIKIFVHFQRTRVGDKGVFISGYNLMQRANIGLELVLKDLRTSDEFYLQKKGQFWKMTFEATNRVIETLYMALISRGHSVERLKVFKRDLVPLPIACVASEASRDLRDWVILSNVLQLTEFFEELFRKYVQSRHISI